jgi:anti-sigma factor RsiW
MNCTDYQSTLHDWFDGELAAPEEAALQAHLAGCAECREEADALRALLADAAALPREIAPPRDLWPEIAARIEASRVIEVDFGAARRLSGSLWRGRALLAAAAVVLVLASSAVTAAFLRRGGGMGEVAQVEPAPIRALPPAGTALAAFEPAEADYERTISDLHAVVEAGEGVLAPETIATLETNLRIIDKAIAESRAALEADPNNRDLVLMLSGVYRQKVELLQTAVMLQKS